MKKLYPDYSFRRIPPDDPIYRMNFRVDARQMPLRSIHNGIRHLVIHSDRDLSWDFQARNTRDVTPWQFMANAYYYATEKGQIRAKLEQHFEQRNENIIAGRTVHVGRVRHGGNWNPEPLAWELQANFMHNEIRTDIAEQAVEMAELADSGVSFAHVVGTDAVEFSEEQMAALKRYVDEGGVVLFEAAGGNAEFADAVADALRAAYPGRDVRPISLDHPVISGDDLPQGFDNTEVDYRMFALYRMGRITTPRLQAITIDGEPRILLSYEDLTEGMLDQPVWGVFGYSSESARKLVANMALWAAQVNPYEPPSEEDEAEEAEDAGGVGEQPAGAGA
jgi:hypothetical protein